MYPDANVIGTESFTPTTIEKYYTEAHATVTQVRPILSWVGSIIFRNEEEILHGEVASVDFNSNEIVPRTVELGELYVFKNLLEPTDTLR